RRRHVPARGAGETGGTDAVGAAPRDSRARRRGKAAARRIASNAVGRGHQPVRGRDRVRFVAPGGEVSRSAVAALFLQRHWLERPRSRRLTAASLADLARATCGVQIDSVNVVERAHLLTLWSRFGEFDRAAFERLAYRKRVVLEYLTHVACFVDARDLP